MIGYKGFNKDMTCRGFQYEVGKVYGMTDTIDLCKKGFHFCQTINGCFSYYDVQKSRFAIVRALGNVIVGSDKCVTNKIEIITELSNAEIDTICEHESNLGYNNKGFNNIGHNNIGANNVGNDNDGSCNVGNFNIGLFNDGYYNHGNCNVGSCNVGDYNSGSFNVCTGSAGFFNTIDQPFTMFNKTIPWACDSEEARKVLHTCVMLQKSMAASDKQAWWNELDLQDKKEILSLPNFDKEIFYKCTGIDVT